MKVGLRGKMLLVINSLLIISFLAVAVVNYIVMKSNITKQSNTQLVTKTDYMREKVTSFFSQRQIILQDEAGNLGEILKGVYDDKAGDKVKARLMTALGRLKEEFGIIDIYVGYPDGSIDCGSGWVPDDPAWKANERPWYTAAADAKNKLVYTDIYIDSDTKKPVITLSEAIINGNDKVCGVVALDIGLAQLAELFSKEKIGDSGYPFLLDKDGRFIIHPQYAYNEDVSQADTIFNINGESLRDVGDKLLTENSKVIMGKYNGVSKVYYSEYLKDVNFYIVSTLTEKDYIKELDRSTYITAAIMTASLLFFIFFVSIFIGRIANIINSASEGMKYMAEGNLNTSIIKINRNDELGDLARAMDKMQNSVKDIIHGIINETDTVNRALNITNNNISELTRSLEETSITVEQLSAGMGETASSTQEISATSDEIIKAAEKIDKKARDGAASANEISKKALRLKADSLELQTEAEEKHTNIKNIMDGALEKIKEVEKIRALSDAILQISSQTNLLALNAAIESSRAGEAGRGFSVVAEEIRKLAEQSKGTVNEIQKTIEKVYEAVENLVNASKYIVSYVETKVVESYKESVAVGENYEKDAMYINNLVDELSLTSMELLTSIKTVSEGIYEISRANNEGAEGTTSIAERVVKIKDEAKGVNAQAGYVKKSADTLKNLVSKFKI